LPNKDVLVLILLLAVELVGVRRGFLKELSENCFWRFKVPKSGFSARDMLVLNLERSSGGRVMKEEIEPNGVSGDSFACSTAGELSLSGWCY
jgi:hypothetical protein